jgi:hypothetical protein
MTRLTRRQKIAATTAAAIAVAGTAIGLTVSQVTSPSCAAPPTFVSGETFNAPPNACYTLTAQSINLTQLSNVTINGGTWNDPNKSPGPHPNAKPTERGRPAFYFGQGANDILENATINGVNNPGGYNAHLAFNAGILAVGTPDLTITNVTVNHVFGDCLELLPRRGLHGVIEAAVNTLTVTKFTANVCGRQGISPVSLHNATFTNVSVKGTGFDSVDDEADQSAGEGAKSVTFNAPCMFSKTIVEKSGGSASGPITFNGCSINTSATGEAILVTNLDGSIPAGPITLNNSIIQCGSSIYVACLNLNGANAVLSGSTLSAARNGSKEKLYTATHATSLTFSSTTTTGGFKAGTHDATSTVIGVPS